MLILNYSGDYTGRVVAKLLAETQGKSDAADRREFEARSRESSLLLLLRRKNRCCMYYSMYMQLVQFIVSLSVIVVFTL